MTRNKIEKYTKIVDSIHYLKNEIQDIKTTDVGIGHSVIMDYRSGYPKPQTVRGFDQELYNKKQKKLECKEKEEADIRGFIENIEDDKTRAVFKLRYFKRMTWQQIANVIEESDECYPRRYIHDKFLSKNLKATENTENTVL